MYQPEPQVHLFPESPSVSLTYDQVITKAKEVLASGYPMILDGICPDMIDGKKCLLTNSGKEAGHTVVISGYRKMCNSKGVCRDVFKIQNSWGEDWQQQTDGGWLDAKALLASIKETSGKFGVGTLAWYTKK